MAERNIEIEFDTGAFFIVTLARQTTDEQVTEQIRAHEPMSDIGQRIPDICSDRARSTPELLQFLGYKTRTGNFKRALTRLLDLGCLKMTIPDKPRSRFQKYRLTDKGKTMYELVERYELNK